jgi:acylphosphatase
VAREFAVTGYVRNLDNGNVELVAEAEADEIARFLETLGRKMSDYIKRRQDVDSPATSEFRDFAVHR